MSPESVQPFSMIPTPAGRSETKPRTTGLTMMMDWGLPIGMQREWLELLGPFVDFAKLVVGTARLYEDDYLRSKIDLYKEWDVLPFLGGQFLEFVYATQGISGVQPFCEEAVRVGVGAVEVSDNVVPLTDSERRDLIGMVASFGLEVHGEVGSKVGATSGSNLIDQAADCIDAGASIVLVEGAELLTDGRPMAELIDQLGSSLDPAKVMYELSGPWIHNTHWTEVHQLKVFLVNTFGPDVNLANIMPQHVFETEALRRGLSTNGPGALHSSDG